MRADNFVTLRTPLQWVVYVLLGSVMLVLLVNARDSGAAKTPLLLVFSSLLVSLAIADWLHHGALRLTQSAADVQVMICFLLTFMSACFFFSPLYSWPALSFWFGCFMCYFAGSQLFNTQHDARRLFAFIAVLSAVVSLVGVVQFFFSDKIILEFYLGNDRRVGSTIGNSAFLGGYIVLVFPVLLSQTIIHGMRGMRALFHVMLLGTLVFLLCITQSRSSIIAFACSGLLFFLLTQRSKTIGLIWVVATIGIGLLLVELFLPHLADRFLAMFAFAPESTFARRTYFWTAGVRAFFASPWFGHGTGSYESVMLKYRLPDYWVVRSEDVVPHAHNEIVELASDYGVVGLVAFIATYTAILRHGFKASRAAKNWERITGAGLTCGIIGILIDNMANVSLRQAPVAAFAWLFMGMAATLFESKRESVLHAPPWLRTLAVVPVIAWIAFVIFYGSNQLKMFEADKHLMKAIFAGNPNQRDGIAIEELKQAIDVNPHLLLARSNLSLELIKAGRAQEALESSRQLRVFSPQYPKSSLIETVALLSLNKLPEALESINREIQLRNHPEAFYVQSLIFRALKDSGKEREALENILRQDALGHISYQIEYASTALISLSTARQEYEQLRDIFEQLRPALPGDQDIVKGLSKVYDELGDTSRANQLLKELQRSSVQ